VLNFITLKVEIKEQLEAGFTLSLKIQIPFCCVCEGFSYPVAFNFSEMPSNYPAYINGE
jgi:hypothetical protein